MKTVKRTLSLLLSAVMLFGTVFSVPLFAYADDTVYFQRGVLTDGTNTAYYVIDKDNRILYLTGDGVNNGRSPDYPSAAEGPFAGRKDISKIIINEDVERVGDYTFANITSADTLEIQSNLLSDASMSTKAMIGCTGLRTVQGESNALSTDVLLQVIKGAINIYTGNWLEVAKNVLNIGKEVVAIDGELDDDTLNAMVDDYIYTGEAVFIGEMSEITEPYQERSSNPCYSGHEFHHNYDFEDITTEPTCTEEGVLTHTCSRCGSTYTEPIEAYGHEYQTEVLWEPSCSREGIVKNACIHCDSLTYTPIAKLPHTYEYYYDAQQNRCFGDCINCDAVVDEFESDIDALISAAQYSLEFDENDYTADSYAALRSVADPFVDLTEADSIHFTQEIANELTANILTAASELVPMLNLNLSGGHGDITLAYGEGTFEAGEYSIAFATPVTLTATAESGYTFDGWYETRSKRVLSTDSTYSFAITSNTNLEALFSPDRSATLTFTNHTNQVVKRVTRPLVAWNATASVAPIAPEVPYRYGYIEGQWDYDDEAVIAALRRGENVTVSPVYQQNDYIIPDFPDSIDGVTPALSLLYRYDGENEDDPVGSFIMTANIPDAERIVSIGTAFYYKTDNSFMPQNMVLTINNKMLTSKFDGVDESGVYISNMHKFTDNYVWAVRGYVTYYDNSGKLLVAYSGQINIKNHMQI